jgi:CBS domain-containing protein
MPITPSPAVIVRADLSIAEAIRLMNRQGVGSVLVRSDKDSESDRLIGIFTERDLLRKVELIESGRHWKRPVRTVMSQPVETLELSQWDQAPAVLLRKKYRHLPITHEGKLLGVVSIREVLDWVVQQKKPVTGPSLRRKTSVVTLSEDPRDLEGLRRLVEVLHPSERIETRWITSMDALPVKVDLFVLDLDALTRPQWAPWIEAVIAKNGPRRTLLLFDPALHPTTLPKALAALEKSKKVTVFKKPLSLFPLATTLTRT